VSLSNACFNHSSKNSERALCTGNRQSRSFFKKSLDLVASKLSLEVVPFWKTQANSGDHSATMFLGVFLFFLAFSLGLGI
jgi:hypothetical protein